MNYELIARATEIQEDFFLITKLKSLKCDLFLFNKCDRNLSTQFCQALPPASMLAYSSVLLFKVNNRRTALKIVVIIKFLCI